MPTRRIALLLLALLPAAARGAEPAAPRDRGDLAIRARAVLRKYCAECHDEKPTRTRLSLLDHRQVTADRGNLVRFVTPGDPGGSRLLELVEDGAMPPGGRPRPSAAEVATLRDWIAAKTPHYPKEFDDPYVLAAVRDDLAHQKWDAAPPFRYLSFAHLVGDADPPDLKTAEQRLRDALAAAAGRQPDLHPLDAAATVFRLDLRDTGWLTADLFDRIEGLAPRGAYPIVPFDLLLLEYPYTVAAPQDERLGKFLNDARQLRPVPFLRADWVADTLRKDGPLAADLLSLTELAAAKDKPDPPCGPVPRPFAGARPVGGRPPAPSPLAPVLPPLGAWYSGDVSAERPLFTLSVEVADKDGKPLAEVPAGGPFHLKVRATADASFTVLRVNADGEVRLQPVGEGTQLKAGKERLLATDTGPPFHARAGLRGAASATEYIVVIATDAQLPELTVIRSRHSEGEDCVRMNRYPIHRFIPAGKGEKFDPARVVRKVVPLKVVKPPGA
jgi:hypothetical protein